MLSVSQQESYWFFIQIRVSSNGEKLCLVPSLLLSEEARYVCPECGNKVFRGAVRCNQCKVKLSLD